MEPLLNLRLDIDEPHHITMDGPLRPWERERLARARRLRMRVLVSIASVLVVVDAALVLLA